MLYIRSKKRSYPTKRAGQWDFANAGGAISNITLGVFIPANAVITRFYVKTLTAPVGAGGSISFGIATATQLLMVTTGIAAFVVGQVLEGIDFNANPTMASTTPGEAPQITMTISATIQTAGRLAFAIEFDEFDV